MNKIFLSILSLAYILTFIIVMTVVSPGYRFGNMITLTGMFLVILILHLIGHVILSREKNPIKRGAIYGGAIGIISFLGSLNWYYLCYRTWCDPLQTIRVFNWINLPLFNFWMAVNKFGGTRLIMAVSNFTVFLLLGILFGYIYKKKKNIFWYSLIGFIIAYLIVSVITLGRVFAGFG